jgi:hypothetical protein
MLGVSNGQCQFSQYPTNSLSPVGATLLELEDTLELEETTELTELDDELLGTTLDELPPLQEPPADQAEVQ